MPSYVYCSKFHVSCLMSQKSAYALVSENPRGCNFCEFISSTLSFTSYSTVDTNHMILHLPMTTVTVFTPLPFYIDNSLILLGPDLRKRCPV